jgi:ATP-binding cassette subfamily E protein 1
MMIVLIQQAEIYIFDEPTSYLDVKQRIKMAKLVRSIQTHANYIIVVEHDLSILDYLSDFICCLYGEPAAYGVVTMPFTVREGINIFLSGFVPTENMRFRDEELTFKISDTFADLDKDQTNAYKYPAVIIVLFRCIRSRATSN